METHPTEMPPSPQILTVEGDADLSQVAPDDLVSFRGANSPRAILMPAGTVLSSERQSITSAEDGATERLDGKYVTKLGGAVIGVSNPDASH